MTGALHSRTRVLLLAALTACALMVTLGASRANATVCADDAVAPHSLCVSEEWIGGWTVGMSAQSEPEISLCTGLTVWSKNTWVDSSPVACGAHPVEEITGYSGHPYVYNNSSSWMTVNLWVWG
jgi:hypothetical protein